MFGPVIDRVEEFILAAKRRASPSDSQLAEFVAGATPSFAGGFLRGNALDLAAIGARASRVIWSQLPAQPSCELLALASNNLGVEGSALVAKQLPGFHSLRHLHWGDNGCSTAGLKSVLDGLKQSTAPIESLWFGRNELVDRAVDLLAESAHRFSSLRCLDLFANPIAVVALCRLLDALVDHPIEVLLLDGLRLHARDIPAISARLQKLKSLRAVSLGGYRWNNEALRGWAELVASIQTLEAVSFRSVELRADGAHIVADMLSGHPSLAVLDLSFYRQEFLAGVFPNEIGEQGSEAILEACEKSPSIRSVNLRGNQLSPAAVARWAAALDVSTTLRDVNLDSTGNSQVDLTFIASVCRKRNAALPRRAVVCDRWNALLAPVVRFRTARNPEAIRPADSASSMPLDAPTEDDLETALRVLTHIVVRAEHGTALASEELRFRALLARWNRTLRPDEPPKLSADQERTQYDRAKDSATQASVRMTSAPVGDSTDLRLASRTFARARPCYGCHELYETVDREYDQLCPPCAESNRAQRTRFLSLKGCVAVVTGARVRIGFATTLRLLRAGATVHATSRFCNDAMRRYCEEPDFEQWSSRLNLHRIDLRWLTDIQLFVQQVSAQTPAVDILVNNAAQTIAQTPEYYQTMLLAETETSQQLPVSLRQPVFAGTSAAPLSELHTETDRAILARDDDGMPLDQRSSNSWRARVGDVSLGELVSVHAVNALAPYALLSGLRNALRLAVTERGDAFVINVSSMEGQFAEHAKSVRHPHTNMAKAALNMLTRTSGFELRRERIWMNSVDPGWISAQNPMTLAAAERIRGWAPPLQASDAAARIVAPIADRKDGAEPIWGKLLKNFVPTDW